MSGALLNIKRIIFCYLLGCRKPYIDNVAITIASVKLSAKGEPNVFSVSFGLDEMTMVLWVYQQECSVVSVNILIDEQIEKCECDHCNWMLILTSK